MDRTDFLKMLDAEGLIRFQGGIKGFLDRSFRIMCNPSINTIYLLRKMQYYASSNTPYGKIRTMQLKRKLLIRYGMHVSQHAQIGVGLRIPHPTSIVIGAKTVIGDNFTIYQNTTIGGRRTGDVKKGNQPLIGNNVTVFAGAMILGGVHVGDNVIIAANSVLMSDAEENGVYAGTPAKRVR